MRKIININSNWYFVKDSSSVLTTVPEGAERIDLPHSWNSVDGQDGGNDYFRGKCVYIKELDKASFEDGIKYLEVRGANSSAEVYLDGKKVASHDGGYSTFRADITEAKEGSVLTIIVDNGQSDTVYPQMADFTFYGGIYRDVNIICVDKDHFDLEYYGAPGIMVTPKVDGKDADVEVETFTASELPVRYTLLSGAGEVLAVKEGGKKETLRIDGVRLWNGRKDPYLYSLRAELIRDGEAADSVEAPFGVRTFEIDPEKGFILNGEKYPLRGVSRHQDMWGKGNALSREDHERDMDLIMEVGATTIRLAHYQHDQYFYDLCDQKGLVIWAEIPYISKHMPTGRENTITQMKELVAQNYNHPSIVVWGLSNEISMQGSTPDLLDNHKVLNDLCHEMDPTRLTTIAVVSMCDINDPYIQIPDVVSHNHYFGWYGGDVSMNGPWFDNFHAAFPNIPVGMSEYGCEALNWHTSNPRQGDYTEEYQSYYHEELIKQLFPREYIWATHVWNMFDFGADARSEGGENGQNHKGLVTFDRKYKKDSFYAYKAWLSDEPFVHLCSKRYIDRVEDVTKVTVYSNQEEVELFANGVSMGKKKAADHFFKFDVPNVGETVLKAVAGPYTDCGKIRKVSEPNPDYILKEKGAILNWFDITAPEGYYSLNDPINKISEKPEGQQVVGMLMKKIADAVAATAKSGEGGMADMMAGPAVMQMLGGFTIPRMVGMLGMMNFSMTKEELLELNAMLNKIAK